MKRAISLLLAIMILVGIAAIPAQANERSSTVYGQRLDDFLQYGLGLNMQDKGAYYELGGRFYDSGSMRNTIEVADFLADTGKSKPEEEDYIRILAELIVLHDLENAELVSRQKAQDTLKNGTDYAVDLGKIAIDGVAIYFGAQKGSQLAGYAKVGFDAVGSLLDIGKDIAKANANMAALLQDYSDACDFLTAVEKNASGDLRSAARKMRESMDTMLETRIDGISKKADIISVEGIKFLFTDDLFDALKDSDLVKKNKALASCMEHCNAAYAVLKGIPYLKLGFGIGKLVGNLTVGGENLLKRYLEIMALHDIADALYPSLEDAKDKFSRNYGGEDEEPYAHAYVDLGMYVTSLRQRGEYCLYSVCASDGQLLSAFHTKYDESNDAWYERQTDEIAAMRDVLRHIFDPVYGSDFGEVVSFGGRSYYWQYSLGSYFPDGFFGSYAVDGTVKNDLICLTGNEWEVIKRAPGTGDLAYAAGKLFYEEIVDPVSGETRVVALDTTNDYQEIRFAMGELLGVTEDGRYVIFLDADKSKIRAIEAKTTDYVDICPSKNEYGLMNTYVDTVDDYVIYEEPNDDIVSLKMRFIESGAEHFLGTFEADPPYIMSTSNNVAEHRIAYLNGVRHMFFSYGATGGSALMYQGGKIASVLIDPEKNRVGEMTVLAGSDDDLVSQDFILNSTGGVTVVDGRIPDLFYVGGPTLYYVSDGVVYTISQETGEAEAVFTPADYSGYSSLKLNVEEDGKLFQAASVSVTGGYVFVHATHSRANPDYDLGWREGYTITGGVMFRKDLETGEVKILYTY